MTSSLNIIEKLTPKEQSNSLNTLPVSSIVNGLQHTAKEILQRLLSICQDVSTLSLATMNAQIVLNYEY